MKTTINGIKFSATEDIDENEAHEYIRRGIAKYGRALKGVHATIDGDFVDLKYDTDKIPFDRIRRITGYLVGTMDRWNSGKRAEEKDRVKHAITD